VRIKTLFTCIMLCLFIATPAYSADRWVLAVGINDYQVMGKLKYARQDAQALGALMGDATGFKRNRVFVLTDNAKEFRDYPSSGNIRRLLSQITKYAEADDTVLVFFAGHGIVIKDKGYFVPADGGRNAETCVSMDWLKDKLKSCKAKRKVLVLDTCHAGSARGVSGIGPSIAAVAGLLVLASCAPDEISYPEPSSGHGVFSSFLLDGLSGKADADGDRIVTDKETFTYVREKMKDWCIANRKEQTPQLYGSAAKAVILTRIPEIPTLSVKAINARTGSEIRGAEVFVNGRKVGVTPLLRYRLAKGASITVEVKPNTPMMTTHKETIRITRNGAYTITARLEKVKIRVPPGFSAVSGAKPEHYTNTGWAKEVIHEKTGIEMVFIPAGQFQMGSNAGESEEKPVHTVRITRPFYMGKYEVTQGEWRKVMGSNPSYFKGDRNPVERVTWNDCQSFLRKTGNSLRLPTEAQWEYACRAGTTTAYSYGSDSGDLGRYAWHGSNSGSKTHPVGEKLPNGWGVYDMHGNVWEWCADWYDGSYYGKSAKEDPKGPTFGGSRVLRGGSWGFIPLNCRSAFRFRYTPDYAYHRLGFRVIRGL